MTSDALSKRRIQLLAHLTQSAPTRATPSQALAEIIAAQEQRTASERAKDADVRAYLTQIAEQGRCEQVDRDAQARWDAMNDHARAHLIESVQQFGSDTVEKLWRRTYDVAFVLPLHLPGIVGDAE